MPRCENEKKDKTPSKWPDLVKKSNTESIRLEQDCSIFVQFRQNFVLFATEKDVMWFKMVGTPR
jgi:hypothetical protein